MVPIAKIFFMFKLLDSCEVPEVRVQVDMREAPDGSCAASVRYLAPGSAYYSAVELGDGNISVGSLSDLSPALEFLEQGEFEDGWLLSTSGYLQFETDFARPQILEIDAASCTCR